MPCWTLSTTPANIRRVYSTSTMETSNYGGSNNNNQQTVPQAKYTEVDQNGEVIYQSDSIPADITATYVQPRETIAQRNAAMTGERTGDSYRTFNIPEKFDNPGN